MPVTRSLHQGVGHPRTPAGLATKNLTRCSQRSRGDSAMVGFLFFHHASERSSLRARSGEQRPARGQPLASKAPTASG